MNLRKMADGTVMRVGDDYVRFVRMLQGSSRALLPWQEEAAKEILGRSVGSGRSTLIEWMAEFDQKTRRKEAA